MYIVVTKSSGTSRCNTRSRASPAAVSTIHSPGDISGGDHKTAVAGRHTVAKLRIFHTVAELKIFKNCHCKIFYFRLPAPSQRTNGLGEVRISTTVLYLEILSHWFPCKVKHVSRYNKELPMWTFLFKIFDNV